MAPAADAEFIAPHDAAQPNAQQQRRCRKRRRATQRYEQADEQTRQCARMQPVRHRAQSECDGHNKGCESEAEEGGVVSHDVRRR